jgi:hypothetical protein
MCGETPTHLESLIPGRVVHSGDIHHGLVLALRVISQKGQDWDDRGRGDIKRELVLVDGELLDVFRKTSREILPVGMERRRHGRSLLGRVDTDRLREGLGRRFG